MIYSDNDIKKAIASGDIKLAPYDEDMLQPSSIDVHLDKYFRIFDADKFDSIDPSKEQEGLTKLIEVPKGEPFILKPKEFVLGSTIENIEVSAKIASRLEGKSSLGRLGILNHSTAGFIDPGFKGNVTLELFNLSALPILLWPGMKIGQLCFFEAKTPTGNPYGLGAKDSRYREQTGPTESKSYLNFSKWNVD